MKKPIVNSLEPSEQQLNDLIKYYQAGRYEDAEKLSLSITEEFPKHPFAWKVLAFVLKLTGRISESIIASQKTVQLNPQDAEALNNLGVTLKEQDRLDEAEINFRKMITLKPDYAEAHYNLGNTLQKLRRLDETEASYTQAIALKPDYAEAHSNLGNTLQKQGRLKEAETIYKKTIELKPDFFEAFYNLGDFYRKQGKFRKSIEIFYKVLDIEPNHKDTYYKMINALENEARFFSNQEFKKMNLSSKLTSENLDSKKLVKKNIIVDEKVINSLNNLSKTIKRQFGVFYTEGGKKVNYSINNGPCAPFANEFFIQWNLRFYNQVKIVFVMSQVLFESKHVLIKLPNDDLFDGGLGVHKHNIYEKKNLKVIVMEKYDLEILNKYAWGLDRKYPYCPNFSKKEALSLIIECLDNI